MEEEKQTYIYTCVYWFFVDIHWWLLMFIDVHWFYHMYLSSFHSLLFSCVLPLGHSSHLSSAIVVTPEVATVCPLHLSLPSFTASTITDTLSRFLVFLELALPSSNFRFIWATSALCIVFASALPLWRLWLSRFPASLLPAQPTHPTVGVLYWRSGNVDEGWGTQHLGENEKPWTKGTNLERISKIDAYAPTGNPDSKIDWRLRIISKPWQ